MSPERRAQLITKFGEPIVERPDGSIWLAASIPLGHKDRIQCGGTGRTRVGPTWLPFVPLILKNKGWPLGWSEAWAENPPPVSSGLLWLDESKLPSRGYHPRWNYRLVIKYPLTRTAIETGMADEDVAVGMPATIFIGSDSYASRIESLTAKTVTCLLHGESLVFRLTKRGWRAQQNYRLALGEAINYSDPSF